MESSEEHYEWEEQNDDPYDSQVWDELFWEVLSYLDESGFKAEEVIRQKPNESHQDSQTLSNDQELYIALINFRQAVQERDERQRLEEERSFQQRQSNYQVGEFSTTETKDELHSTTHIRKPGILDEVFAVISGIIAIITIILLLIESLELTTLKMKIERFFFSGQSSVFNNSRSYDYDSWGCPEGCTYHKDACDIKGNKSFNTGEKIYHLPGQTFYADTVINPEYGERWFCTEEEAQDNGWRKSSN